MLSAHSCVACMASLQAEDGHDQCPACLGVEHLREAVSDNPCMNCSFMPHALRLARLAEVEGRPGLPPSGLGPSGTRRRASAAGGPPGSPVRSKTWGTKWIRFRMRLLRLKPSYRTSNQLRVYQPRPLRLRNPLIQRMTCCLQLRPVASLQRRKSKRPLPLRRSLKGLWAARLEGQCPAATLLDQPCEWPWQDWGWMKLLFHLHL